MSSPVDLTDVQGDIIFQTPKSVESFIFFKVAQVDLFKRVLGNESFLQLITSAAELEKVRDQIKDHKAQSQGRPYTLLPFSAMNIAFTQPGLTLLGLTENIFDRPFTEGQLGRALRLGDRGQIVKGKFDPTWFPEFKKDIDGLILIFADSDERLFEKENKVLSLLGSTIQRVLKVSGSVRPGDQRKREHFGYVDGISQPAIENIPPPPFFGQQVVKPGVILMGQEGDPHKKDRPSWAKNGSILVYRHLDQLVPEFDQFKRDNALRKKEIGIDKGAALLGARLFGRWKDGTPVDISPTTDDPDLAKDPNRNNNFDFSKPTDQSNCPWAAHIRKTNPRSDLGADTVAPHAITRRGITFGSEVTDSERKNNKTECERGLAFVCYQSSIDNGFEFIQVSWSNSVDFIFGKTVNGKQFDPGFDPIIGQNGGNPNGRFMGGYDLDAQGDLINLPMEFVISKGGAYLFSPSISTIKNKIGTR